MPADLGFSVSAAGNGEELALVDTHIDPWADEWPACDLDGEQVVVDWSWDPARDMAVQVDCGEEARPQLWISSVHSARTLSAPECVHAPRSTLWAWVSGQPLCWASHLMRASG